MRPLSLGTARTRMAFVGVLLLGGSATASAQSARPSIGPSAGPSIVLGASGSMPAPFTTSSCASTVRGVALSRATQDSLMSDTHAVSGEDTADVSDDSIDSDGLPPGIGMVVVDSRGTIVALGPPADSSNHSATQASPTVTLLPQRVYTASNGSDARAGCVDAMKPPPRSLSPL